MHPLTRAVAWASFAGTMYLILAEAVWPWLRLPSLGNVGFTLVFVVFAVAHCAVQHGWRRTGVFFAASAIVSYLMEEVGVRSGLVFGAYHYGDLLGPKLGHVPVIIPLAWFMMIYPSWMVARELLRGVDARGLAGVTAIATAAAFVMTGWDVVMDPGMAAAGNWIWEKGGAYFGVPRHNYLGWLITTFLVYWIVGLLWRFVRPAAGTGRWFEALAVIVYAFFAVRYVIGSRMPAMQVIAMFSMGLAGMLALMQIGLNPRGESRTV
jgi:putative membrane protein